MFNGISIAINTITLGHAGMEEDNDFSCLKSNLFQGADAEEAQHSDAVNRTLRQRSMQELPLAIAELGWTGTSFCDGVARGYADMTWGRLRALEKETLLSCLRQRHLGAKIAQQVGILSLQSIPYDWSERVKAVYRLSRTAFAYLEGLSPQETRRFLTEVEYAEYLPAVRRAWLHATTAFTPERVTSLLQTALTEVATIVRDTGDTGARLVRVVGGWSNVTTRAAQYWADNNVTAHAYHTAARVGHHLARAYVGNATAPAPPLRRRVQRRALFAHPVLLDAGRKVRVVADAGTALAKDANTYLLGAAGVSSDVNPCDSAFSIVCLNCKLLDNILETLVEELVRGALFFRYTYAEITLKLFMLHVRGRALALRDGLANGAKDIFSNVEVPRPENIAAQFDRMTAAAGANAAYAAVAFAKNAGNALGVLETAAASTAAGAFNRTSATAESLQSLRARADAYALGADPSAEAARAANMARRPFGAPTQFVDITFAQRTQIDWDFLWTHFPYVPTYTLIESTRGDEYVTNIETISVIKATAIYLSTTDASYCPLYGYGLFYSLSRPLLSTCDMDNVIYSRGTTQSERMELFDEALWTAFFAFLAIFGFQYYVGLPLLAVIAPLSATLLWYLFAYKAYGFSYNCVPSVPVMLGADVSAYINRWHPEPLCMRYSALAESCDPHADLAFHNTTAWKDCFADPAVHELGYFYSLVYYARELAPDAYNYVRRVQPWRYWLSGVEVLDLLDAELPLRENCARLLLLDAAGVVALGGTLVWLFFALVVPPVIAVARAAVQLTVQVSGLANLMFISVTRVERVY